MSIDAIAFAKGRNVRRAPLRLLLYVIAENTFNDSGLCKVGQEVLANDTGASVRTTHSHLKRLALDGLIEIQRRYEKGGKGGRQHDAIRLVGFLEWLREMRPMRPKETTASPTGKNDRKPYRKVSGGLPENRLPVPLEDTVLSTVPDSLPLTPRKQPPRVGGIIPDELSEEPVVMFMLRPVLQSLPLHAPEPGAFIADLVRWAADAPPTVLCAAAGAILRERSANVRPSHLVAAIRQECKLAGKPSPPGASGVASRGITINRRTHPVEFDAWLSSMRASGDEHRVMLARRWEREGSMLQPTLMPEGTSQSSFRGSSWRS